MNIKPFGNRILVKPVEHKQVLVNDDGGLSEYGDVVAVGDEVKIIKIGDRVGFSVFGVEKLMVEEEKYYFIEENSEFLLCTIINELSE